MDIAQVKSVIMTSLRRAGAFIKSVTSLPYFKTYLVVSVLLTLLFIVITFPYGELIRSRLKKMEEGSFKTVDIGYLDVSLFGESTAESITLVPPWGSEINIQSVILDGNINPYSLYISKDYHGSVRFKNFSYNSDKVGFDSNINCNYEFKFKPDGKSIESGSLKIFFENSNLKLNDIEIPGGVAGMKLSLPPMRFSSIVFDALLRNDTISLQQVKLSGPDLKCSMSGSIKLTRLMMNSQLNITMTIEADSPAIEKYKDFLSSNTNADGDIVLTLSGTMSRPGFGKKGSSGSTVTEPETETEPENISRPEPGVRPRPRPRSRTSRSRHSSGSGSNIMPGAGPAPGGESPESLIPGMEPQNED